jgi:hypothetical protein
MQIVVGNPVLCDFVQKSLQTPSGYPELLQDLKSRIERAQVRAAFAVSRELVLLYWSIGSDILARQGTEGWGARVIDRLSHDLQIEFPGVEGFSPRSLKYMRSFAEAWPEKQRVQQVAALFALGTPYGALGPSEGCCSTGVVPPGRRRVWLEPERDGAAN